MSKKKIKKSKIPKNSSSAIKPTLIKPQGISFSFKYYEKNHNKFVVNNKQTGYWLTLLDRLRSLSSWSVQELLKNRSGSIRFHIDQVFYIVWLDPDHLLYPSKD